MGEYRKAGIDGQEPETFRAEIDIRVERSGFGFIEAPNDPHHNLPIVALWDLFQTPTDPPTVVAFSNIEEAVSHLVAFEGMLTSRYGRARILALKDQARAKFKDQTGTTP